jgi:hypothetical protein
MHRAKAFSGKKKKEQLKAKRERKRQQLYEASINDENDKTTGSTNQQQQQREAAKRTSVPQPVLPQSGRRGASLLTQFYLESEEELRAARARAEEVVDVSLRREPWRVSQQVLACEPLPIPLRPPHNAGETREALEARERAAFAAWLEMVQTREAEAGSRHYYETNLEVWRQLWRSLERARGGIVLLVVDARFPLLGFPAALYAALRRETPPRRCLLVLNKCDLCPPEHISRWREFFRERHPELPLVAVSSFGLAPAAASRRPLPPEDDYDAEEDTGSEDEEEGKDEERHSGGGEGAEGAEGAGMGRRTLQRRRRLRRRYELADVRELLDALRALSPRPLPPLVPAARSAHAPARAPPSSSPALRGEQPAHSAAPCEQKGGRKARARGEEEGEAGEGEEESAKDSEEEEEAVAVEEVEEESSTEEEVEAADEEAGTKEEVAEEERATGSEGGGVGGAVPVCVVGQPNVGKSSARPPSFCAFMPDSPRVSCPACGGV